MLLRRNLLLAWTAVTLMALAPVFAYAHIHVGANGKITEHCAAEEPENGSTHHDHSQPNEGTPPHCPYCPGFSAGAALSVSAPSAAMASVVVTVRPQAPPSVPAGRSSVRIAQQRGPPASS